MVGAGAEVGGDGGAKTAAMKAKVAGAKGKGKAATKAKVAMKAKAKAMKAIVPMKAMKEKGPPEPSAGPAAGPAAEGTLEVYKKGQRGVSHHALVKRTNSPHPPAPLQQTHK